MNNRQPRFSGIQERILTLACDAVLSIDSGRCTMDDALDAAPADCRRSLGHLLMQLYRYRKSIRASWSKFCTRPPSQEVAVLLDCTAVQCFLQSSVKNFSAVNIAVAMAKKYRVDKFVNAILRNMLKENFSTPCSPDEILPNAILDRWKKVFPYETIVGFAELFLKKPNFTFRLCGDAPIPENCVETVGFPPFRFACGEASALLDSAGFSSGRYYIQDPAASMSISMCADIIPKCSNILDLCAAPGGKSLMAAELMQDAAELCAADISAKRQRMTAENFASHRIAAKVMTAAPENISDRQYDLVIADVPCSNTGVFRKRPDALWRFTENSLKEIMTLQKHIISHAARLTAAGKWLLISTCSIEQDENSALISQLSDFSVLDSKTLLPDENHDGAFAALLQKNPL